MYKPQIYPLQTRKSHNYLKHKNYGVTRDTSGEYRITLPPADAVNQK